MDSPIYFVQKKGIKMWLTQNTEQALQQFFYKIKTLIEKFNFLAREQSVERLRNLGTREFAQDLGSHWNYT